MKTIIETTQLEFDKSIFLIDLVEHDNGLLYIEIIQNIKDGKNDNNAIKINPTVITDIIKVLQNFQAKIPNKTYPKNKYITDLEQGKIIERYLKGVSIKDIAMQLDQSTELIEMILRNKEIEIVDNELPKPNFIKRRKRK